jgi:glucoamylase
VKRVAPRWFAWHDGAFREDLPQGRILRVQLDEPAIVRWTLDDWRTFADDATSEGGLGLYHVDLPTAALPAGRRVQFTARYLKSGNWRPGNAVVDVIGDDPAPARA